METRQEEKEGKDRKMRSRVGGGTETEEKINSFVDPLLRCYLKSNALFPQPFLPSSSILF